MSSPVLELRGLTVRFGGLTAVNDLSFAVHAQSITGLIGPNGAGKTTTFNACTGLLRPTSGRVLFDGDDVTTATPPRRARLGLGRTFQRIELFESTTVTDNIAMGREALHSGKQLWRSIYGGTQQANDVAAATEEALEITGITDLRHLPVRTLSTGQRRRVELARAVAGGFPLLLLDEPSSGLDHAETDSFAQVLLNLRDNGRSLLLVEHDMRLVRSICDHVHVMDFGQHLIQGAPDVVLASDVVRKAYLGEDNSDAGAA